MKDSIYDVIIIGSGPAGFTAGIYSARGNRKTLILGGRVWGGQLMLTTLVENYPGFPEGIQGPDLMMAMKKQAEAHGAEFVGANFSSADFTRSAGSGQAKRYLEVKDDEGKVYKARAIIIATGADTKWLDVPGEKEKIGRGVASCAPCDAAFYRNKKVIVVGGGDSAMEEAHVLTKFASEVYVVHRRDTLKASAAMQERAFKDEKISFLFNTYVKEIQGDQKVEKVVFGSTTDDKTVPLRHVNENKRITADQIGGVEKGFTNNELTWEFPIDGVFVAIGHIPNSTVFKGIEVDEKGFIKVFNHTRTNIDGVFVAGDVHDNEYKQAITAAGFGCMAALEVEKYLQDLQ